MLFVIIVFNSLSLGYYHGCLGQEPEFKQMSLKEPYSGAKCLDGYTVISYNDLIQFENQLITKHFLNDPIWINAMAEYTPWMIYRGTYYILENNIIKNTALHNKLQFTYCVTFCSAYDDYVYIGLQEDGCFCLSSKALKQALLDSQHTSMPCGNSKIARCVIKNNEKIMTIYERDKSKIYGHSIGECLTFTYNRAYVSIQPQSCSDKKQFILCQEENRGLRSSTNFESRHKIHTYCSNYNWSVPDYTAINYAQYSKTLRQGNYWLANFRQQYFSTAIADKNIPPTYCVTGRVKHKKIELQITNCSKANYVVCIKQTRVQSTAPTKSPVNSTHDIRKFLPLPVIITALGGLVIVLIVTVVVIVIVRVIKKRQANSGAIDCHMYDVIQNNKTINQHLYSDLSTKSQHSHKQNTEEVESMYNEAIFNVSTSLPQQNIR